MSERIYTRCPACGNDTLTINAGHLLCTWHECKDLTLIDRSDDLRNAIAEQQTNKLRTQVFDIKAAFEGYEP